MSRQYFGDLPYADPAIASQGAIVATTETVLFPVAQYLPIPASDARAGKVYAFKMGGIWSTAATGTLTLTPRYGLTSGGIALGASVATTVPVSATGVPWWIDGFLVMRTVNNGTATSSTCMLHGVFSGCGITAGGITVPFGGTSGTIDTTVASGIWIGWTLSVAGSVTPESCIFGSMS